MTTESDNVEPEEYLLRRILNRGQEVDFNRSRPVAGVAFSPTKDDVDGLSLFRELFVSAEKVAHAGRNVLGYYVARIPAREIIELGFTIQPDPREGMLPGHSLIPELTYDTEKQLIREHRARLAQLVNKDFESRIVYRPD